MAKRTASQVGSSNCKTAKVHERRVAELFTEWSGQQFRRRRVTGRDDATLWVDSAADVIPAMSDFAFSIEAKKGKTFSMDALLANPTGCQFKHWWHQTCYDAKLISDIRQKMIYPLLIFKPTPQLDWIAFSARAAYLLRPKSDIKRYDSSIWFPHFLFDMYSRLGPIDGDVSHSKKNPKIVSVQMDDVYICRWKDFADNVDPAPLLVSKMPPAEPPTLAS